MDLTPFELRNGRWYKREDLFRGPAGVNGAKLRACEHLIGQAARSGARRVISAASVLSPQSAIAAVTAARYGMTCTVVAGSTSMEAVFRRKARRRHRAVWIARSAGADFRFTPVAYNPALQAEARRLADADPSAYWLRYGITPPPDATPNELFDFHWTAGAQVENLPPGVRTLVIPFGSGNTGAGVLLGVEKFDAWAQLERIVLVCIGPDRQPWLADRLSVLGVPGASLGCETADLHGSGYARYDQRMFGTVDGIELHPTYEGKVVRYLDEHAPDWWTRRDGSTALWIVGGPIG